MGVLPALEIILQIPDKRIKSASIDILTTIVEYSPSLIRDYTLTQFNNQDQEDDQSLINIAIEQMLCDSEPELGGAVQLMGVIRILLDPENMLASANKTEKTDFLNFFYKHSISVRISFNYFSVKYEFHNLCKSLCLCFLKFDIWVNKSEQWLNDEFPDRL